MVNIFRSLTTEGFGRPHAASSASANRTSSSPKAAGICDVIATTTKSGRVSFNLSGEMTSAGRCLMALRSVNGNGTSTTLPCLKVVVDGILGIVPEFERRLRRFNPSDIIRLDFQVRRQVFKQTDLLTNIQMFNRFADLSDSAHYLSVNAKQRNLPTFCFYGHPPGDCFGRSMWTLNACSRILAELRVGRSSFSFSTNKSPAGRFRRGFELN